MRANKPVSLIKTIFLKSHKVYAEMFLYSFVVVVQLLSCVRLFVTPWTAELQAPLSFTVFQSLLKIHVHSVGDAI